jgi:hypothetical protein
MAMGIVGTLISGWMSHCDADNLYAIAPNYVWDELLVGSVTPRPPNPVPLIAWLEQERSGLYQ